MTSKPPVKHLVAVVGAGPAGIYACKEFSDAGIHVALFNRDLKPGGLAEYGIYPSKVRMKQSLRKHFWEILKAPTVKYFGNVTIGVEGDLTLDDLREMGFEAILVTVGAQGTKWLGLPGEELRGVYHAKDLVYHYNKLPPFSQEQFYIGRRAALIGVGNVSMDIAHWLVRELKIDEVVAVARRGPAEVKFTKKEFEYIVANLDMAAFDAEMAEVAPRMEAVGQDPAQARQTILAAQAKAEVPVSETRFRFEFLSSPTRIVGDEAGNVVGLEVEDTTLVLRDGDTKARGLGTTHVLDVDTVVFCIGDRVDSTFGLPVQWNEFVKNPQPRFPQNGYSYEVYDPDAGKAIEDVFVAGWAREASSGLVGAARKDGQTGARAVIAYLDTLESDRDFDLEAIKARVENLGKPIVTVEKWQRLQWYEWSMATRLGVEDYKFDSNEEMLEIMKLSIPEPDADSA